MTPNQLAESARLLLGTLARAGVRRVIISPGSRSTPFAWAALKEPLLECHSLWDERAAAFFALGQARATGQPSLLLCTSGSAPAHYFPALIEASEANVPVLVLSADRPLSLLYAGAPQTIDQIKLFGGVCRGYFELGGAAGERGELAGLVRQVSHASLLARHPRPGPVHLNVRADKPLEPVAASDAESLALTREVDRLLARGPIVTHVPETHADATRLLEACRHAERGLIVVGPRSLDEPDAREAFGALAERTGFPLLCEAPSQLAAAEELGKASERRVPAFDWLLRTPAFVDEHEPDLIVSFGPPPTSAGYERLLARGWGTRRLVVARHGFPDPHGLADELVLGELAALASRTADGVRAAPPDAELAAARGRWLARWLEASRKAEHAVDAELARSGALSEPQALRELTAALPQNAWLMLGNSLPIRELESYGRVRGGPRRVLCQRGANGIDGLIAGAAGSASVAEDPLVLLLGDVSFVHDLGGLAAARGLPVPLVIVVIDNGGGRIFEQLPVARLLESGEREASFWLTPPHADLAHAAAVFGHGYRRVSERSAIRPALGDALGASGTTVVHVVVEPDSARAANARVLGDLARRLGEGSP